MSLLFQSRRATRLEYSRNEYNLTAKLCSEVNHLRCKLTLTSSSQTRSHATLKGSKLLRHKLVSDEGQLPSLELDPFGKVPGMRFEQTADGRILFRYVVDDVAEYPGFDGRWREMTPSEIRETLRMGGRVAEWLHSLD